jgi:hypothetical protein
MILGVSGLLVDESGTPLGSASSGKDTLVDMIPNCAKIALADVVKRIVQSAYDFTDDQLWGPSHKRNEPDKRYPRDHTWVENTKGMTLKAQLDEVHNNGFRFSCACCGQIVGRIGDRPDNDAATQCYLNARYTLTSFGTTAGRDCYENTWIDYTVRTAEKLIKSQGKLYYKASSGLRSSEYDFGTELLPTNVVAVPDCRFRNELEGFRARGAKLVRIRRVGAGLPNAVGMHQSEREVADIPDDKFDLVIENNGTLEDLRAKVPQILDLLIR